MWRERKILIDGFNAETQSRVEVVEDITHRFFVNRCPVYNPPGPDFSHEYQNEVECNKMWSRLMSEKLELF